MGDSGGRLSVLAPGTSWVGVLSRASTSSSAPESGGACSPFVFLTGGAVFCIEKGGLAMEMVCEHICTQRDVAPFIACLRRSANTYVHKGTWLCS